MAKKCPPGFICFENITLILLIIILLITIYYVFSTMKHEITKNDQQTQQKQDIITRVVNIPFNVSTNNAPSQLPLPISTQRGDYVYRQVGILTRVNGPNLILPLYGRMVNTSRSKWQYYSMNDSNTTVALPINVKGQSGTYEYGVDELYNGDTVYVEGYDEVFKVTIYKTSNYYYSPF